MMGLWTFLVWTCVLGSSYVHSQGTVFNVASNLNLPAPIVKSPTNSETVNHLLELNAGNTGTPIAVTPPNPDLNTVRLTEATIKSPAVDPVNLLAQQLEAVTNGQPPASVNQVLNAAPLPMSTNTGPMVPEVTQAVNPAFNAAPRPMPTNTGPMVPEVTQAVNPAFNAAPLPMPTNTGPMVPEVTQAVNPAFNAAPRPMPTNTGNIVPEVTQSPAAINLIPIGTLERPAEPVNTAVNNVENLPGINPILFAPAATNVVESATIPSNPASSVPTPSTGQTNPLSIGLNKALKEVVNSGSPDINQASASSGSAEPTALNNPLPVGLNMALAESTKPASPLTNPLSTALDTALTQAAKPASAVTNPASAAANSVPIPVNPEVLSVTPATIVTNSVPATNIQPIFVNPSTATEASVPISAILASAVSGVTQGTVTPLANIVPISVKPALATEAPTLLSAILASALTQGTVSPATNSVPMSVNPAPTTETTVPISAILASAIGAVSPGPVSTVTGTSVTNSLNPFDMTPTNATLNTTQGGALVNSSVNANASSTGFNVTAVDPLTTTSPIDPRIQKRIDQGVLEVGAKLQSNVDFYTRSLKKLDDLIKDINVRREIMEEAIKNLPKILAGMIKKPTSKVKLSEILREANASLALQAPTMQPDVSIVSALASVSAITTGANALL
ncbi:hypothetical protein SNE40_006317 [Patella caerulea]|uniref:Uncharacterized protein n=1 Tax=Patella caerulea TaxID=87958 RepID=A0AAN8K9D2_PATCE